MRYKRTLIEKDLLSRQDAKTPTKNLSFLGDMASWRRVRLLDTACDVPGITE